MSYILFDVGTNWGENSLGKAANDPNIEVWAFEPTPALAYHLMVQSESFSNRYHVQPIAVGDFNGILDFYIQDNPGQGCNSLNQFNDNLTETWKERAPEFRVAEVISVPSYRLDAWLPSNIPNLEKIDYFHCDTQGHDLKVLQGMGEYIHLIHEGVVECAKDDRVKLYKDNHTVDQMTAFLESKGFTITSVESNDHLNNEWNVHFKKKETK
jgi:FkbM family methyltransferase